MTQGTLRTLVIVAMLAGLIAGVGIGAETETDIEATQDSQAQMAIPGVTVPFSEAWHVGQGQELVAGACEVRQ